MCVLGQTMNHIKSVSSACKMVREGCLSEQEPMQNSNQRVKSSTDTGESLLLSNMLYLLISESIREVTLLTSLSLITQDQ